MGTRERKTILFIGDVVVLVGALALSLYIRYGAAEFEPTFNSHIPRFIFIFIVFVTTIYINQLYNLNIRVKTSLFFRKTLNTTLSAGLISIIYFYLSISSDIAPKTNLFLFMASFFTFFYAWRLLFEKMASMQTRMGVAIIGDGDKASTLSQELEKNHGAGYQLEMIARSRDDFSELASKVTSGKIRTVVICHDFDPQTTGPFLLSLLPHQVNIASYPEFYEIISNKVPVEALGTSWFLENLKEGQKNYFSFLKRIADIVSATIIILVTGIFWPLIAIAIRLETKGPALYKQTRLGHRGNKFTIYKFRTMKVEDNNGEETKKADDRITACGHLLRKTRLDELPQTFNILKGEMSFIGPRPERPELASDLEESIPFYNIRLIVKPGLSGLDQVSGEYHSPSKEDTLKKLQYDLFYIKNRSLYLDFIIILKTIATVLKGYGR